MPDLLTTPDGAGRGGVASSALGFYEARGLIAPHRTGSGHRRYPRPVLRRIAFIVFAQRIGLSLDDIGAELAKLPPDRAPNPPDLSPLSSILCSMIHHPITELKILHTPPHSPRLPAPSRLP